MPYNSKSSSIIESQKNDMIRYACNLVADKEKQIKIASIVGIKSTIHSLRDELDSLRNKYSQFLPQDPIDMGIGEGLTEEQPMQPIEDSFGQEKDGDPVPTNESELNNILFQSIADSFTTVLNENDEPVFDVRLSDPNTIIIEYSTEKGGVEKAPFIFQNLDQFMKPILLDIVDKVGFGEENPEAKKQALIDEIKEPIEMYRDSLESRNYKSGTKEGKNVLIYKRSEQSLVMASKIYDILKKHGLAGPIADMDYEEIAQSDNMDNTNTMGEPVMEAKSKSFNLRKHADKLFDTVRERVIQETDPQYKSRHGKHALPWYEDAYIPEVDYKENIMDKYYPEQLNADGEYRGGYINDRFIVHHNTEGNSLHVKPGTRGAPDRVESYSTERRLEEMRNNNLREYELSEGSKTEQQTNEVTASKNEEIVISEDCGLYKIVCGSKVAYLDTEEQIEAFKEIKLLLDQEHNIISDTKEELNQKKK